jgi:hypothetical protein
MAMGICVDDSPGRRAPVRGTQVRQDGRCLPEQTNGGGEDTEDAGHQQQKETEKDGEQDGNHRVHGWKLQCEWVASD